MEKHYVVTWKIDEWANTPEEAIAKAILSMPVPSNEDSIATVFEIVEVNKNKFVQPMEIDTLELEDEERERFIKVLDGQDDDEQHDEDSDEQEYKDFKRSAD